MNRRDFIKVLTAVSLFPVVRMAPASEFSITRKEQLLDFGEQRGLMVAINQGGNMIRHAIRLLETDWQAMTDKQREQTWRFLEQHTIRLYRKRFA